MGIALSRSLSLSDPPVDPHPADRNARPDDDDPLLRTIQGAILARTGLPIHTDHARRVAGLILGDRVLRDPAAAARYARRAIEAEPDPRARFITLAAAPARSVPWCGKCDEATRLRDHDGGALGRCPDRHPLTQGGQS
jgi:hypothetical protein